MIDPLRLLCTACVLLVCLFGVHPAAAQTCTPGEATAQLDVNNVHATLRNTGALVEEGEYIVPHATGLSPLFTGGLWAGGTVDGVLRMAAATYTQFGTDHEWFPGPLQADGTPPNPDDCSAYDRIWTITQADLDRYEQTGEATADLAEWPVELGAPVVDGDGIEGNYDLVAGDRPDLVGDQMAWWAMNDAAGPHLTTQTDPIGLEARVTAYAYEATPDSPLFNTTFVRYALTYRPIHGQPLQDAYLGWWADSDLGQYTDDYAGSDSALALGYVYNGDDLDEGGSGYGERPPAFGVTLLDTPRPAGDPLGLTHFMYFVGDEVARGNPSSAEHFYGYLQSVWKDGTPLAFGGDGYTEDESAEVASLAFPATPPAFWSEDNIDGQGTRNVPADRRVVASSGPFTWTPGATHVFEAALVWSRSLSRLTSVAQLHLDVAAVRAQTGLPVPDLAVPSPPSTPALLSPSPEAPRVQGVPTFAWTSPEPAAGTLHRLQVARDVGFTDLVVDRVLPATPAMSVPIDALSDETSYAWRVLATNVSGETTSRIARFTTGRLYDPATLRLAGDGAGIVEVATANGPLPSDAWDETGAPYGGNTVWRSLNADVGTQRYYVSSRSAEATPKTIARHLAVGPPGAYELRFTEAGGLGVFGFQDDRCAAVPFEVWNTGALPDDPADDVRMIPLLERPGPTSETFSATSTTEPFFEYAASDVIYVLAPHPAVREAYAQFAQTCQDAGGPGALYPGEDGSPERFFAQLTYPGIDADVVYPLGELVIGDFDGDGLPPAAGTIIRFNTTASGPFGYAGLFGGLNGPAATPSEATGSVTATQAGGQLMLSARFAGLRGAVQGIDLVERPLDASAAVAVLASLHADLGGDERSGTLDTTLFVPPRALAQGRLALRVRTAAYPSGEVYAALLPTPNEAPTAPELRAPASGSTVVLTGDAATRLPLLWDGSGDPNGNPVVYAWQLARDAAFTDLVLTIPAGTATSQALTYAALDSALAQAGVPDGETVRLYQRVVATDGSLATPGPVSTLTLTRGTLVRTGTEGMPPATFALQASYPNPFRQQTTLVFDLPEAAGVSVAVYDLLGRRVLDVPERLMGAGADRTLRLEPSGLASGVYLYRVTAETPGQTWRATGRLVRMR